MEYVCGNKSENSKPIALFVIMALIVPALFVVGYFLLDNKRQEDNFQKVMMSRGFSVIGADSINGKSLYFNKITGEVLVTSNGVNIIKILPHGIQHVN